MPGFGHELTVGEAENLGLELDFALVTPPFGERVATVSPWHGWYAPDWKHFSSVRWGTASTSVAREPRYVPNAASFCSETTSTTTPNPRERTRMSIPAITS